MLIRDRWKFRSCDTSHLNLIKLWNLYPIHLLGNVTQPYVELYVRGMHWYDPHTERLYDNYYHPVTTGFPTTFVVHIIVMYWIIQSHLSQHTVLCFQFQCELRCLRVSKSYPFSYRINVGVSVLIRDRWKFRSCDASRLNLKNQLAVVCDDQCWKRPGGPMRPFW